MIKSKPLPPKHTDGLKFLSAVLIVSKDVARLGRFYRNVLGVPLEHEQHGELEEHYGCELGELAQLN
jgi:catechol 2,3-dioxygenase-like lactoylglutathione lyase family enzyme